METIIVIIVVLVLIVIGMGFFYKYMIAGIETDNSNYRKQLFDNSVFIFPQQAEITCSNAGDVEGCLDSFKMIGFQETVLRNKGFYRDILGFKNISVEIVYPKQEFKGVCNKNNFDKCNLFVLYSNVPQDSGSMKNKRVINTPISVYLTDKDEYAIGILRMEGYNVQ